MPVPIRLSTAGSRVVAAVAATNTTIAAVYPSVVTIGMPAAASDRRAMITVLAAKTTAPPEVAVARATDSRGSILPSSSLRWRVTMNSV
jgi:hypothetical protein